MDGKKIKNMGTISYRKSYLTRARVLFIIYQQYDEERSSMATADSSVV